MNWQELFTHIEQQAIEAGNEPKRVRRAIELVLAEMERLSKHLESVGIDRVKAGLGEVFQAMFVVARSHPNEATRVLYGAAVTQLWTSASMCVVICWRAWLTTRTRAGCTRVRDPESTPPLGEGAERRWGVTKQQTVRR